MTAATKSSKAQTKTIAKVSTSTVSQGIDMQVPYNKLFISESNVRKTRHAEGLPELAALIEAQGLMQRLSVVKGEDQSFGVVAGGRRYASNASCMTQRVPWRCRLRKTQVAKPCTPPTRWRVFSS
jgi:hypothetical protein